MAKTSKIKEEHYAPLDLIKIEIKHNGDAEEVVHKYGYSFSNITFEQGVEAEERSNLRLNRMEAMANASGAFAHNGDAGYYYDMAGILFTPIDSAGNLKKFDSGKSAEIAADIRTGEIGILGKVEAAIEDFFTQRGNRSKAYEVLGNAKEARRFLSQTLGSLTNYFGQNSSSTIQNLSDALKSASETPQSEH